MLVFPLLAAALLYWGYTSRLSSNFALARDPHDEREQFRRRISRLLIPAGWASLGIAALLLGIEALTTR